MLDFFKKKEKKNPLNCKISDYDLGRFKDLGRQRSEAYVMLESISRREEKLWEKIRVKYNIPEKKFKSLIIDYKKKIISEVI